MRTNFNRKISSIEDAKSYLSELHANFEAYHPDDSANEIIWTGTFPPTDEECDKMDALMDSCRDFLDPCEELNALDHRQKTYVVLDRQGNDFVKESGYTLYFRDIREQEDGTHLGEFLNIGEIGDTFDNGAFKVMRVK